MTAFSFYRSFENSETPCLVREDAAGGDPHIIAHVSRVYNAGALHELCALANRAQRRFEDLEPEIEE